MGRGQRRLQPHRHHTREIDAINTGFTRTWQRPPSEQELKAQLDDRVREGIATRQAMAMSLDRDDKIIRRRLRLKFEDRER